MYCSTYSGRKSFITDNQWMERDEEINTCRNPHSFVELQIVIILRKNIDQMLIVFLRWQMIIQERDALIDLQLIMNLFRVQD